jgi:hypothetical protein
MARSSKEKIMKAYLTPVGLVIFSLIFVVNPAFAKEFWVARDPDTKKCEIVKQKPDGQTKIMIGTTSYPTKEDAKAARAKATVEECPQKPSH